MYLSVRDFIHQVALQRTFTKRLQFHEHVNCRLNMSHVFCPRAGIVGPSMGAIYDMCQKFLKLGISCLEPKINF